MNATLVREGHLICSSTFRRMLNMATDDALRALDPMSCRGFKAVGVCGHPHLTAAALTSVRLTLRWKKMNETLNLT